MYKTYFNWSSGKDSALALYYLLQEHTYQVDYLLTTVNTHYQRVTMHGVRLELLEQQLNAIGIPHGIVELPEHPTHGEYEMLMRKKIMQLKEEGFQHAAFGDIFLEDLKQYREQQLNSIGVQAVFPLWKRDTKQLIREFVELGFKAIVVCVNAEVMDISMVGRVIDERFLNDLPADVDPCGENGEFHTFCFDGSIFSYPIKFTIGEIVVKEYSYNQKNHNFWFCDLLPISRNNK